MSPLQTIILAALGANFAPTGSRWMAVVGALTFAIYFKVTVIRYILLPIGASRTDDNGRLSASAQIEQLSLPKAPPERIAVKMAASLGYDFGMRTRSTFWLLIILVVNLLPLPVFQRLTFEPLPWGVHQ